MIFLKRPINYCGSLAPVGVKINIIWLEKANEYDQEIGQSQINGIVRKRQRDPQHNQSKAISSLFFSKMIAKLERIPRSTPQNNVSKGAKIRNRYNQVPHLSQDTNGIVTNSQLDTTNESQEVCLSQQVTTKHI